MGFLDNLENQALGRIGGGNPLISSILQMIQNQPGGISGLVQRFQQQGLGGAVNSWISTGQNQPVSADQVEQALGPEQVQQVAQQAGIPAHEAKSKLAEFLPMIVDKLTPNGEMPQGGNLLQKGMEMFGSIAKTGTEG